MTLFTLLVELTLALARLLGLRGAALDQMQERATGAALQREEDLRNEQIRISAAARAGLDPLSLPDGKDPFDRDGAGQAK